MNEKLRAVATILKEFSLQGSSIDLEQVPLFQRIAAKMAQGEELVFILPAFPAKSPCRHKTYSELPDLGEVLALKNLQQMCERIKELHAPGARILICSDGRAFSDLVQVSDEVINRYNDGIMSIIADFNLSALEVVTMDDLYPEMTPAQLRDLLLSDFAKPLIAVKERVRSDSAYTKLFNGIHRFLFEDEFFRSVGESKSAIQKRTKEATYELLRRSDAWSELLARHFEGTLRLSIHPHEATHEKFGIKLVPSSSKWGTPWHNVVVKIKNRFELMHRQEAHKIGAVLKMEQGRYAYFEIPAL